MDVKRVGHRVVDGPPRSPGDGKVRDALPHTDVHDRNRTGARDAWVADVGDQQPGTPRVVGETVGPDADGDLLDRRDAIGTHEGDGVLASI